MYMCMSVCVSYSRESWGGLRRLANKTDVRSLTLSARAKCPAGFPAQSALLLCVCSCASPHGVLKRPGGVAGRQGNRQGAPGEAA